MRTKHAPKQNSALFPVEQRARSRRTDPVTSAWAAQGIVCNRRQAMVLTALIQGQGTQHDIIKRAREIFGDNIAESTIRTGVSELMDETRFFPPLVESLGPIGTSPSGHKANVFRRKVDV